LQVARSKKIPNLQLSTRNQICPPTEVGGYENKACWSRLTWKLRVACWAFKEKP